MTDIADILDRAADLIEPEGAWTQRCEARDAAGRGIDARDPRAVCWCAEGALEKVTEDDSYRDVRSWLEREVLHDVTFLFNDVHSRTQAEVVAKLREAAAKARGEAA